MQKIKSVGIVSLAKLLGVVYSFFGLLAGLFVAVTKMLGIETVGDVSQLQAMGYWSIIIIPIVYGVIGASLGLVSGFFINQAFSLVGPLEIKIVQSQE